MNREQVVELLSGKAKLIRVERDYTQEKMAEILGISKKTLVQVEKGRSTIGWTGTVALCALFRESEIVQSLLGEDPLEVLEALAHEDINRPKEKTMGGKIWWHDVEAIGGYRLQQNMFSKHFRILDEENHRWYSTFEEDEAIKRLKELATNHED